MTEQIKNERAGNIFGGNQTEKLNIENTLTELDLSGWWYSVVNAVASLNLNLNTEYCHLELILSALIKPG